MFALLSTIPMQIGEGNLGDEPKQEETSVSVNGDVGPTRWSVKQDFSEIEIQPPDHFRNQLTNRGIPTESGVLGANPVNAAIASTEA